MNTIETLPSTSRAQEYLAHWARLISEYLGSLLHTVIKTESFAAADDPETGHEEGETGAWIRLAVNSTAEQAFFFSGRGAAQLVRLLGGGAANQEGTPGAEGRKAIEDFFSGLAAKITLADWLGFDAELKLSGFGRPEWQSALETAIRFSSAEGPLLALRAQVSEEFASALRSAQAADTSEKKAHPALNPYPSPPVPEAPRDNRLELLMDVELEVVLRFGQREMLLHDVLTLTPGTVLELDQHVQDPVELLVGNKVIAWGEVVAVDGNYGLRITSLASRKERLESLRK